MRQFLIHLFFLLFFFQIGIAQNIKGKIIDSKTGESIPYANINVKESENLISNAEGDFTLAEKNSNEDTQLTVSYLGYLNRQITIKELKRLHYIIELTPAIFQLPDLTVSNEKPDPYKIMARVKENLNSNYKNDGQASKEVLFIRKSNYFKPLIFDVVIEKSTGFTKQGLSIFNVELKNFSRKLLSEPPQEFTDMLCNYYTFQTKTKDKQLSSSKIEVLKATKLKDGSRSTSVEELQKESMNLILKHLDSTKYYRVKSGFFGSHDTISLRKEFIVKKNKNFKNKLTSTKSSLDSFIKENNFAESSDLDFINHPELYQYVYEGTIYSNENEFVYVLSFKPKKSKAVYAGKLYVSETDYAVLRTDYALYNGKKVGGFNMKFLLGVKAAENIGKGIITYKKKTDGNGYYMQYGAIEKGFYFYLNRPLKFIELSKNEKDVVALELKVEGNGRIKTEFLNVSHTKISEAAIEKIKEVDFNYINIKSYDPKIWKDYNAIEPVEEMKKFKSAN